MIIAVTIFIYVIKTQGCIVVCVCVKESKENKLNLKCFQGEMLTENSMFFLSWFTALGSGTGSVCLMTDTDSPSEKIKFKYCSAIDW